VGITVSVVAVLLLNNSRNISDGAGAAVTIRQQSQVAIHHIELGQHIMADGVGCYLNHLTIFKSRFFQHLSVTGVIQGIDEIIGDAFVINHTISVGADPLKLANF